VAIRQGPLEGLAMKPAFWHGKRVLLTGHTGFKGSWLSLWLQSLGADLIGYALPAPTTPSLFELGEIQRGMNSVVGDIRDIVKLQAVFNQYKPEIVIHMAAQPLVRYSYDHPVDTFSTNVMGTVHLLECVRNSANVRAVVNVTTDKCYENREWAWGYRENEPMGGHDPYSSSKGCAELVTAAYRASYFSKLSSDNTLASIATARAGNVIGGGDWSQDRLIPDILAAFKKGTTLRIRNPNAIRPWQHVLEPLRGYLTLAERLYEDGAEFAEGWNFGPNDEDAKPVSWIVQQLASHWGDTAQWEVESDHQTHEANFLKLDISKARTRLNWQPEIRLQNALELIIDWTRTLNINDNVRENTLNQITSYQAKTQHR